MPATASSIGKQEKVPRALGQTFATLAHLADLTIDWGFKKMKKVGDTPISCKNDSKVLCHVKRISRPVLRFIGSMGDAYYEWYEKLKAKRAENK